MKRARTTGLLVTIAFVGAIFTPCQTQRLVPIHAFQAGAGEENHLGEGSGPVSHSWLRAHLDSTAGHANSRAEQVILKARCPCGCDERPAVPGSSPGLGVALVSRGPSVAPLSGDQELVGEISFLPTSPLSGIDTVPRSA